MRIENIKENTTYYLIVESSMFRHYPVCFIQEIKFEMWDLPLNESLMDIKCYIMAKVCNSNEFNWLCRITKEDIINKVFDNLEEAKKECCNKLKELYKNAKIYYEGLIKEMEELQENKTLDV
jgi:hypothetical protein